MDALTSILRVVNYVFAVSYAKKLCFKYGLELFYNNCFEKNEVYKKISIQNLYHGYYV